MVNELSSQTLEGKLFKVRYQHVLIKGTPYEAGRLQGESLKQTGRKLVSFEPPEPEQTARQWRELYDKHVPGLTEEIQGLADSLCLPFEKALFCATISQFAQGCTHAVVLPGVTADRHLYIARNYDMAISDADMRLGTTQIDGRANHLGFTDMCLGRLDGINQYGLCTTLSYVWDPIPEDWQEPGGMHYAYAIRSALERCQDLDEAVDLWQSMPIGNNGIFLAADRSGDAAWVEIAGRKRAVKRIGPDTIEQYMVAANHYVYMDFTGYIKPVPHSHSTRRCDIWNAWLDENRGQITADELKAFLDRDWATGVSSYSTERRSGTLWSMVFDVTAGNVEIRFGPPPHNRWHSFTFDGLMQTSEYVAEFPK